MSTLGEMATGLVFELEGKVSLVRTYVDHSLTFICLSTFLFPLVSSLSIAGTRTSGADVRQQNGKWAGIKEGGEDHIC